RCVCAPLRTLLCLPPPPPPPLHPLSLHDALPISRSTFRFAAPAGTFTSVAELAGKRIATSYDGLLSDFMKSSDIQPERIVHLDGAVESSVSLGVADAIADVVETGSTLKAAGMEILGEPILHSEA